MSAPRDARAPPNAALAGPRGGAAAVWQAARAALPTVAPPPLSAPPRRARPTPFPHLLPTHNYHHSPPGLGTNGAGGQAQCLWVLPGFWYTAGAAARCPPDTFSGALRAAAEAADCTPWWGPARALPFPAFGLFVPLPLLPALFLLPFGSGGVRQGSP